MRLVGGCAAAAIIVDLRLMATQLKDVQTCGPSPSQDAPDLRPVEGTAADEELALLAKALGHPARVQILRLLVRREACICGDIVDELPLAQSTVSQHLKVLKEAGLIRGEVDGPRVCYCIEPRTLRRLKSLVGSL
jgi:ArsR family transcriptional regulator, arsenate/arsenite/antimonite-responsive transcriptional repressor